MPGPKMGPRPEDFDEELVRRSPTFRKWENLMPGSKLRYACREFVKGQGDDEERLMRRIMIARRNNVRDHQALKWARRMQAKEAKEDPSATPATNDDKATAVMKTTAGKGMENGTVSYHLTSSRRETEAIISRTSHLLDGAQDPPSGRRSRRPTTLISDEAIMEEMDVDAVEATRSYKTWLSLPNGSEFLYNQKYIKGMDCHDWLLKKNIWRRMRYRRENKRMVEQMLQRERGQSPMIAQQHQSRKRRHNETATASTDANGSRSAIDRILVDSPTMLVNSATSSVQPNAIHSDTNPQEVVASTASEIVDHALLSTSAGVVVPAPNIGNGLSMSIGDSPEQQQLQDQHHHDVAESAAAFAASIALAGVGIGTDGDLNSHHAEADSAAVEAAVAAALAATDAKSNSYHHHLSPSGLDPDLLEHHVVHGSNDPLEPPDTADTPTASAEGEMVPGLGLALDAAAKLAAAAATLPSDEAVLAATKAVTAMTKGEKEDGNEDQDTTAV